MPDKRPTVELDDDAEATQTRRQYPEGGTPESLKRHMEWLYPDPEKPCLCESAWVGLGSLHGIQMGKGWVRTTTHPKCPEHALCQGYTDQVRAKEWNGEWLYCNVHGKRDCPALIDGSDDA